MLCYPFPNGKISLKILGLRFIPALYNHHPCPKPGPPILRAAMLLKYLARDRNHWLARLWGLGSFSILHTWYLAPCLDRRGADFQRTGKKSQEFQG